MSIRPACFGAKPTASGTGKTQACRNRTATHADLRMGFREKEDRTTGRLSVSYQPLPRRPIPGSLQAGFLAPGVRDHSGSQPPAAPSRRSNSLRQWQYAAVVTGYSGASAADSHGLPVYVLANTCNASNSMRDSEFVNPKNRDSFPARRWRRRSGAFGCRPAGR